MSEVFNKIFTKKNMVVDMKVNKILRVNKMADMVADMDFSMNFCVFLGDFFGFLGEVFLDFSVNFF